ncbi:hypothetical protein HDU93_002711, partial [Gonapodya sp. JEL0774]
AVPVPDNTTNESLPTNKPGTAQKRPRRPPKPASSQKKVKPPPSGFALFQKSKDKVVRKDHPEYGFGMIAGAIRDMWTKMTEEEKGSLRDSNQSLTTTQSYHKQVNRHGNSRSCRRNNHWEVFHMELHLVLLRHANVIQPFEAAGKQDTLQKRWMDVAEVRRKENPALYAEVTHQNTNHWVRAPVIAWAQRNTGSEKLTGENEEDSVLDAMVEEYANAQAAFNANLADNKENALAERKQDMKLAADIRQNATETLSKKRPLRMGNENEDWTVEDITNRKKRGRTASDAWNSLFRLEELLREDTQEKEGYLAMARQADERRMKELELKERKLAVEEEQVKLATANQQMMMEMFKSFVSQKQ